MTTMITRKTIVSRRMLLHGGALAGAGAALAMVPGSRLLAQAPAIPFPNVAKLIERYVDSGKVANMVVALGMEPADPSFLARGTLAIGQPARAGADSLYRLYSMTKPITGMAAMILIDEGRMRLDQPISDFLPKFAAMQRQRTPDGSVTDLVPVHTPITIRHLLTHTAGLGYTIVQKGPLKALYEKNGITPGSVSRLPLPMFTSAPAAPSLEVFADRLAALPLVYEPGTRWSYSVALDLMGRIIEVVSGRSFDGYLKERLFDPLGMTSTFFTVPAADVGRLTTNYAVWNGLLLPIDIARTSIYLDPPAFPFGGAGLVSSPRDYDRFLAMLANKGMHNGTRVMSAAAVAMGTSNLLPDGADTSGTFVAGQGFGAGGRVSAAGGRNIYGWGGAAGTVGFVDTVSGLRGGLYTQYMPAEAYPLTQEFTAAVIKDAGASTSA